ncbi:unnamed protein product, partial [marine sediment metagenome]
MLETGTFNVKDVLVEMKDLSDSMLDLAYSAILYSIPPSWNNLSGALRFVSKYIRENTPDCFDEYIQLVYLY